MASEGLEGRFLWECRTRTAAGLRLTKQFLLYSQTDSSSSPPSIEPRRPRSSSYCSVGGERNVRKKKNNKFIPLLLLVGSPAWMKVSSINLPPPFSIKFVCVRRAPYFILYYSIKIWQPSFSIQRQEKRRKEASCSFVLSTPKSLLLSSVKKN